MPPIYSYPGRDIWDKHVIELLFAGDHDGSHIADDILHRRHRRHPGDNGATAANHKSGRLVSPAEETGQDSLPCVRIG